MAKTKGKNTIKIAAATSLVIFTLFATCTASFAWFTSMRNQQSNTNEITVEDSLNKFKSFSLYPLLDPSQQISGDATQYVFSATPSGVITYNHDTGETETTGNLSLNLGIYSLLDQIHPVLGIFEFYEGPTNTSPINIYCHTDSEFVGETEIVDDEVVYPNPLDYEDNPLSSIIEFHSFALTSLSSINNMDESYIITKNKISQSNPSTKSFVTINTSGTEATFVHDITLYQNSTEGAKYVCCIFDYNLEALNYIYSVYLGTDVIQGQIGDSTLNYICDFSFKI